jgi:hypothetical protein
MAKRNFIKDLAESHHPGSSDVYSDFTYNHGCGKMLRGAVNYEYEYDEQDNLPIKSRGSRGRFGWDRRQPAFKYTVFDRWLNAQVGRPIDKVTAEAMAFAKGDDPASRKVRAYIFSRYENLQVRGEIEVYKGANGWPEIVLVDVNGREVQTFTYWKKSAIYVNRAGILCCVSERDRFRYETARKQYLKKQQAVPVKINGTYYFCLNGAWQELQMASVEEVQPRPVPASLHNLFGRYFKPVVQDSLCEKLGLRWDDKAWTFYGTFKLYCTGFRTLAKREVKRLLLDVQGGKNSLNDRRI